MLTFTTVGASYGVGPSSAAAASMWQILASSEPPVRKWKRIFGDQGERGEYMDGYSEKSMIERCIDDYQWTKAQSITDAFSSERAGMMSHLYDNERLWEHVSMVAFAEHYVLPDDDEEKAKPFDTFQKQKYSQPMDEPIFGGVVFSKYQSYDEKGIEHKLAAFKEKEIDYVRLECNLGTVEDIQGANQLEDNPLSCERFDTLAKVARRCQDYKMVPLVLLQMPWREPGDSQAYFDKAVKSFASALKNSMVESDRFLFETRPPIGMSSEEEKGLSGIKRTSLGLEIGQKMFEVVEEAFDGEKIAGFCVAGGSTKGDFPTAMEDDTQNAVRQGMRRCALRRWGYEVCFWEMGAKLMLQPKVGQLWGSGRDGRDAARELFRVNAGDLADEIKAGL